MTACDSFHLQYYVGILCFFTLFSVFVCGFVCFPFCVVALPSLGSPVVS